MAPASSKFTTTALSLDSLLYGPPLQVHTEGKRKTSDYSVLLDRTPSRHGERWWFI